MVKNTFMCISTLSSLRIQPSLAHESDGQPTQSGDYASTLVISGIINRWHMALISGKLCLCASFYPIHSKLFKKALLLKLTNLK